nr:HupE/UreJ family protein [Chthoniobacterales bacterium]
LVRGGRHIRGRGALTFAFGLVHGLGFAAVLRELGVATGPSAVIPLVSFNGGVEIGQLAVAAVVWPIISNLRQRTTSWTRIGVPACSALVVLAGGYWLLDRTLLSPG